MKKLLLLIMIFFIVGCQNVQIKNNNFRNIDKINQKVKRAFENHKDYSKWINRKEKLPLTIIGIMYLNPLAKKTVEYKYLTKLIQNIAKKPKFFLGNLNIIYSNIKYKSAISSILKFNIAYKYRYEDKDKLNDVLRPDIEHPSQELLIMLDYEELKKGNLTLKGYKTVKETSKLRNSYFYTLRKEGFSTLNKKQKQKAIYEAILTILHLKIPDYVSVNRMKLLKDNKIIHIVKNGIDIIYTRKMLGKLIKLEKELHSNQNKLIHIFKDTDDDDTIAFSPDGKYILSGGDDGMKIWDIKTYKLIHSFKENDTVECVAFSPNGKYLASATDRMIKLWNAKTYKLIYTKIIGDYSIYQMTFSPNSKYIVILNGVKNILEFLKVSNVNSNPYIHIQHVITIALSPNGKYLALEGKGHTIKIATYSYFKYENKYTLKGHKNRISSISFSPNGKYIVSGSWDKTVKLWDIQRQKLLYTFRGFKSLIRSVTFSSNGRYIIAASNNDVIKIWDTKTYKLVHTFENGGKEIASSPKHRYFTSVYNNEIKLWKIYNPKRNEQIEKEILKEKKSFFFSLKLQNNQLIITSPLDKYSINVLQTYHYIDKFKQNLNSINNIANIFDYEYLDPVLLNTIPEYESKTNAKISYDNNTFKAFAPQNIRIGVFNNIYFVSKYNYLNNRYIKSKE